MIGVRMRFALGPRLPPGKESPCVPGGMIICFWGGWKPENSGHHESLSSDDRRIRDEQDGASDH